MTTSCPECGHEIEIGEHPFCPHEPVRDSNARHFEPIEVWVSNSEPDKFSFPGVAGEAVPNGYHRMEISNLREADKFVARWNAVERQKAERDRDRQYEIMDRAIRERRADTLARIGSNPKMQALFRAAREYADQRRDQKRSRHTKLDPHCHIQVLSFDSGNRPSYSAPETGWREKKS